MWFFPISFQRYSLEGDVKKWLKIDSSTGNIYTASALDREYKELYKVDIVATETSKQWNSYIHTQRNPLPLLLYEGLLYFPWLQEDRAAKLSAWEAQEYVVYL